MFMVERDYEPLIREAPPPAIPFDPPARCLTRLPAATPSPQGPAMTYLDALGLTESPFSSRCRANAPANRVAISIAWSSDDALIIAKLASR